MPRGVPFFINLPCACRYMRVRLITGMYYLLRSLYIVHSKAKPAWSTMESLITIYALVFLGVFGGCNRCYRVIIHVLLTAPFSFAVQQKNSMRTCTLKSGISRLYPIDQGQSPQRRQVPEPDPNRPVITPEFLFVLQCTEPVWF